MGTNRLGQNDRDECFNDIFFGRLAYSFNTCIAEAVSGKVKYESN